MLALTKKTLGNCRFRDCSARCKKPCDRRMYIDSSVSTRDHPGPIYVEGLREKMKERGLLRGVGLDEMTNIEIFYTSLSRLVTEEIEKVPIFNLISNIGGQLGK